jgi:predicted Zn-ribbon and HTH transcriptional regulator
MTQHGGHVALHGVIVGGGYYDDGPGRLGVWLDHDPADFGVGRGSLPPHRASGTMRTGFAEAWLTDVEDDSYDLSWFDELPDADRPAIAMLRLLLETDPDPIDRHFQFAELESRLYRSRDLYTSALDEFDETCRRHDAEMETIRAAFMAKWSKVPLLETYRQMAIRLQKQKDWRGCVRWTERGLELYGNDAAREEAVEDLLKRRNRALAKLEAVAPAQSSRQTKVVTTLAASPGTPPTAPAGIVADLEILICSRCATAFERVRVRGRKPSLCPDCRSAPSVSRP